MCDHAAHAHTHLHCTIGEIQTYFGNWEAVQNALEQSYAIFQKIGVEGLLPEVERHWAELCLRQGELDEAFTRIQRSIDLAVSLELRMDEGASRQVLACIQLARGEAELAEQICRQSLQIFAEIDVQYDIGKGHRVLADCLHARGLRGKAQNHLDQAIEIFTKLAAKPDLEVAEALRQSFKIFRNTM
ncbi:MAG: hypothetical protein AAF629_36680 [Chloroflexota bacterium]